MEKLKVHHDQTDAKKILTEYLVDREQAWQLTVNGLRTHDADMLRQGGQKEQGAERVAARLRKR